MTPPMTANNPKQPEVTEEDREAVAAFHKQSFKALLETTDAEIDAGINRAHTLLCQAFARHRIAAERATRERVLEEAARKAEHSCYDYANTIEPSINDDGSKAFGFGFDYACEVIAAAIRALQEPKV